MTRAHAEAPATWFRLGAESWAEIRREYQAGASAAALGRKWKVSPSTIYRRACADGWTKKACGEAVARAHAAEAAGAEAALAAAERAAGPLDAGALAALLPPEPGTLLGETAGELAAAATAAAGRLMRLGRMGEALGMAKLAEQFGRLVRPDEGSQLQAVFLAVHAPGWAEAVMRIGEDEDAPSPVKRLFWEEKTRRAAGEPSVLELDRATRDGLAVRLAAEDRAGRAQDAGRPSAGPG